MYKWLYLLLPALSLMAGELPPSPHQNIGTSCESSVALSADGNQIAFSSMYFLHLGKTDNLKRLKKHDFTEISFAGDKLLFNRDGTELLGAGQDILFVADVAKGKVKPFAFLYEPRMIPKLLAFHDDRVYTGLSLDDTRWDSGCLPDSRPLVSFPLKRGAFSEVNLLTSNEGCHHLKRFSITSKGTVYIAKDDPENICRTFIYKRDKKTQVDTPEHFRMEATVGDLGIFSDFKEQKYRYGLVTDGAEGESFPFVPRPSEVKRAKQFTATPDESAVLFHALDSNSVQSLWIADVKRDSIGEFRRVVQLNEGEEIHSVSLSNRNLAVITAVKRDRSFWVGIRNFYSKPTRLIVTHSLEANAEYQELILPEK